MTQYTLDISLPVDYSPAQYVVSKSNQAAYHIVTNWPNNDAHALYLFGEKGSGKTHLAYLWKLRIHAEFLATDHAQLSQHPTIVDDIDLWKNEAALFHLYNHTLLHRIPLLISSRLPPNALPFQLPDLMSRLKSLPIAEILPPDDDLIHAVVMKQLSDRQLKITPDVLDYLLPRLPRSFVEIHNLIARLDQSSLTHGKTLTIPFIRNHLTTQES